MLVGGDNSVRREVFAVLEGDVGAELAPQAEDESRPVLPGDLECLGVFAARERSEPFIVEAGQRL